VKRRLYGNIKQLTTIFCICIIAVTLLILILRLSIFRDMDMSSADPDVTIEATTGEYVSYSLNSRIYFSSPTAKGNVLIESDAGNSCYMSIAILNPQSRDTLIYTGMIKPGETIDSLALDVELTEGIYDGIAEISAYSLETREFLGRETVPVTLYIGEKPPADEAGS